MFDRLHCRNNSHYLICIAPPIMRPRAHHNAVTSLYPGVHRLTGTKKVVS